MKLTVKQDYESALRGFEIKPDGAIIARRWNRRPKQTIGNDGYRRVSIVIGGKQKLFMAHRLVALAYVPNPDNKPYVNHINGIKHDNRAENLEWCTQSENIKHAVLIGAIPSGDMRSDTKISESNIQRIKDLYETGLKQIELAEMFGVTQSYISLILSKRRNRRMVTSDLIEKNKMQLCSL